MASIIGIMIVSAVIVGIDVPTLRRNKHIKEMCFFFILLFIGTGLSIAWTLHIRMPSPMELLAIVYKPVHDVVTQFLQ